MYHHYLPQNGAQSQVHLSIGVSCYILIFMLIFRIYENCCFVIQLRHDINTQMIRMNRFHHLFRVMEETNLSRSLRGATQVKCFIYIYMYLI